MTGAPPVARPDGRRSLSPCSCTSSRTGFAPRPSTAREKNQMCRKKTRLNSHCASARRPLRSKFCTVARRRGPQGPLRQLSR
eukprot:4648829-Pyramimonas_sp.AAC.1